MQEELLCFGSGLLGSRIKSRFAASKANDAYERMTVTVPLWISPLLQSACSFLWPNYQHWFYTWSRHLPYDAAEVVFRQTNRFQTIFTRWLGVYFARLISVLFHVFQPGEPLRAHQPPSMLHLVCWKWAETLGRKEGAAIWEVRKKTMRFKSTRERVSDWRLCLHRTSPYVWWSIFDWNPGDLWEPELLVVQSEETPPPTK